MHIAFAAHLQPTPAVPRLPNGDAAVTTADVHVVQTQRSLRAGQRPQHSLPSMGCTMALQGRHSTQAACVVQTKRCGKQGSTFAGTTPCRGMAAVCSSPACTKQVQCGRNRSSPSCACLGGRQAAVGMPATRLSLTQHRLELSVSAAPPAHQPDQHCACILQHSPRCRADLLRDVHARHVVHQHRKRAQEQHHCRQQPAAAAAQSMAAGSAPGTAQQPREQHHCRQQRCVGCRPRPSCIHALSAAGGCNLCTAGSDGDTLCRLCG